MPNICHNRLDVIGPADEADRFVDAISANDYESIDFTLLRPEPSDVGENWYNWRSENWGTKWINGVEWDANIEDDGVCTLSYTYDSAWAPLNASFWAEVSRQFPNLMFISSYRELGMDFVGAMAVTNGGTFVHDHSFEIGEMPDSPRYPDGGFDDMDAEADWHDRYWTYAMDLQDTMHNGAVYQARSARTGVES